jgi:hypothetical protein
MKLSNCGLRSSLLVLFVAGGTCGQDARDEAAEPESKPEKNFDFLPAPLGLIRGNVLDLEATGHLKIADVEFRTRGNGDEALIWTVRVEKAITCRHLEAMLRKYRDVRFYTTFKNSTLEVLSMVMQYSERVELGSANNRLLTRDDVFELIITLPKKEVRRLISLDVDHVVFRRWKY